MKVVSRICLVTREKKNRTQLIRVVKTPQGVVVIDKSYILQGRGCYISKDMKCIQFAKKKNLLSRALRTTVEDSVYEQLEKEI